MGAFTLAWLLGEGIVTWRWARAGAPPTPGALALSSGYFALLGVIAVSYPPSRVLMTTLAYGIDIAALLQLLPGSTVHQQTGWPPPLITDPGAVLPPGNPANTPAAVGGANRQRGAPPGTPANPGIPPTGPGTLYPPGSQTL